MIGSHKEEQSLNTVRRKTFTEAEGEMQEVGTAGWPRTSPTFDWLRQSHSN